MEKKHNFVYKTTNTVNGKYYIGKHSTDDLDDGYIGSGRALKKAILKYGSEKFDLTILSSFETAAEAYIEEEALITKEVVLDKNSYNQQTGGSGGKFYGADDDALVRREKTKRRKFEEKLSEQKLFTFDMMGKKGAVYNNVHIAVKALKLNGKVSAENIRKCASEKNLNYLIYYGRYWSYTKEIPEKCYLPGTFIMHKQKKKKKKPYGQS